jgi:hypothetical protein
MLTWMGIKKRRNAKAQPARAAAAGKGSSGRQGQQRPARAAAAGSFTSPAPLPMNR